MASPTQASPTQASPTQASPTQESPTQESPTQASPTQESRTPVEGSCRCGAVRFRAALDLAQGTTRCNCRYCTKTGWWGAMMKPEHFTLLAGEAALSPPDPEAWGERRTCLTCGVLPFGRGHLEMLGGDFVQINVRCIDDFDLEGVPVRWLDGRNDTWAELAVVPWHDVTRAARDVSGATQAGPPAVPG